MSADKRYEIPDIALKRACQTGFSLFEIMIIVAAIILVIAYFYPAFSDGRQAEKRQQAQVALQELAEALRAFKQRTGSFAGAAGGPGEPRAHGSPWIVAHEVPGNGAKIDYRLRIAQANEFGFEVRAVPAGTQVGDPCGTLTLTATGVRGMVSAGKDATRAWCWQLPD